jgi:glycosyltransferase involved in cell wall biosynthesis
MHILLAHNRYQQMGGEDSLLDAERALLLQHGNTVADFLEDNNRISSINPFGLALRTIYSRETYNRLSGILRRERPDLVHFHNTFPLISPSAYYACKEYGIPVVQAVQNYRLLCPSANFLRDNRPCEACLGKTPPWPAILFHCYRHSRTQTAVVAAMLTYHRLRRTWQTRVDAYVPPTEFIRNKLIRGGIPPERIFVKPNTLHSDPGQRNAVGNYMLYVGRFSPEKGLPVLAKAWQSLSGIPLKIIGAGPLEKEIRNIGGNAPVDFFPWMDRGRLLEHIKNAYSLLVPSIWYEGFPMTILEALACGVPVIASRLGAMAEIIADGRTGLLFTPGDSGDLAAKIRWSWDHPAEMAEMGGNARREYENKYTAQQNYADLMEIYQIVLQRYSGKKA